MMHFDDIIPWHEIQDELNSGVVPEPNIETVIYDIDRGIETTEFTQYLSLKYPNIKDLWITQNWITETEPNGLLTLYQTFNLRSLVIEVSQGYLPLDDFKQVNVAPDGLIILCKAYEYDPLIRAGEHFSVNAAWYKFCCDCNRFDIYPCIPRPNNESDMSLIYYRHVYEALKGLGLCPGNTLPTDINERQYMYPFTSNNFINQQLTTWAICKDHNNVIQPIEDNTLYKCLCIDRKDLVKFLNNKGHDKDPVLKEVKHLVTEDGKPKPECSKYELVFLLLYRYGSDDMLSICTEE